jgi:hypothetical protein
VTLNQERDKVTASLSFERDVCSASNEASSNGPSSRVLTRTSVRL